MITVLEAIMIRAARGTTTQDDVFALLAAAHAAAEIAQKMTPIEHPRSPTDYAYGKVTNEEWRELVAASAPLMKEVAE